MKASYYQRRASECRTRAGLLAGLATVLFSAVLAFAMHAAALAAIGSGMLLAWVLFAAAVQTQDAARYEDREVVREYLRRRKGQRSSY